MEDIAPKMLENIQRDFEKNISENQKLVILREQIKAGKATYKDANEYAIEAGEALVKSFQKNVTSDILPDGKMYYNIAERAIQPMMEAEYEIVARMTEEIQTILNQNAGIGIKAIKPELNQNRIEGIINRITEAELYDNVSWILDEPIVNFSQSIVDESIKRNSEFQGEAGMKPKIVRTMAGNCCEWCAEVAGVYSYPDVPKDVYRRHQRCRCTVDYNPGNGKIQNVHSKKWRNETDSDIIEKRKLVGLQVKKGTPEERERRINEKLGLAARIVEHPKMLQAYTPKGLKDALERDGYEIKSLGAGKFKGISFENGGGYRVLYGGDGYLQYHPKERSHHGGEYYKTSNGKNGTYWYNMEGDEINRDGTIKEK